MIDPILTARLTMLEQNLDRVAASASWLKKFMTPNFNVQKKGVWENVIDATLDKDTALWLKQLIMESMTPSSDVPEVLWGVMDATLGQQARRHLREIEDIRKLLAEVKHGQDPRVQQAWHLYTQVYRQSQDTFDECLTFIGGLAFRSGLDQGLGEYICLIADELIRDCSRQSTDRPWESLTVPALHEARGKTLARIIRLRFQEWTIWTLPFTAHEFGHVVVSESDELKEFLKEEVELLVAQDPKDAMERARKRADFHLNEFLADAFATYTMGPSYGCAAILLRFNPSVAYTEEEDEHPAAAKRAYVVFSMLKEMDTQAGGMSSPYRDVLEHLKQEWENVLNRAGPSGTLSEQGRQHLDALVKRILKSFYYTFRLTARYPHAARDVTPPQGWTVAQNWKGIWSEQLEKKQPLSISSVSRFHNLRDALNAAWLCRIDKPDDAREIAEATRKLCQAIIKEQGNP